jgi:hypothetical protein
MENPIVVASFLFTFFFFVSVAIMASSGKWRYKGSLIYWIFYILSIGFIDIYGYSSTMDVILRCYFVGFMFGCIFEAMFLLPTTPQGVLLCLDAVFLATGFLSILYGVGFSSFVEGYEPVIKWMTENGGVTFHLFVWVTTAVLNVLCYLVFYGLSSAGKTEAVVSIKKPHIPDTITGTDECGICLAENIRIHCLVPCGHSACKTCCKKLEKCHICNGEFSNVIPVYL